MNLKIRSIYGRSKENPYGVIDIYTRTDYNKIRKLMRLDKLDGNRKGVFRVWELERMEEV